jgi:hypothetical protein
MKRVPFKSVPIDSEFYWGAYKEEDMNWGCKRTTRTADWRGRLLGTLSEHVIRGYFGQNEIVYIAC